MSPHQLATIARLAADIRHLTRSVLVAADLDAVDRDRLVRARNRAGRIEAMAEAAEPPVVPQDDGPAPVGS